MLTSELGLTDLSVVRLYRLNDSRKIKYTMSLLLLSIIFPVAIVNVFVDLVNTNHCNTDLWQTELLSWMMMVWFL